MDHTTKNCGHCHEYKEIQEFNKNKSRRDGLHHTCKECVKVMGNKYSEQQILIKKPITNNKITCECGVTINENIYDSHIKTQYHLKKVIPKMIEIK